MDSRLVIWFMHVKKFFFIGLAKKRFKEFIEKII